MNIQAAAGEKRKIVLPKKKSKIRRGACPAVLVFSPGPAAAAGISKIRATIFPHF
jgi:hypothetical protein